MANTRIKDISTAATTLNSDDFIAVDGSTAGTRKMAKADLITEVSTGVSGTYLEESNNLSDVASKDTSKLNLEVPDVGTGPQEVPLNSMLSSMAYQSADSVSVAELQVESTTGTATTQALTVTDGTDTNFVVQEGGSVGVGLSSPSGSGWDESATVLHVKKDDTSGGLLALESSNTKAILNAGNNQLAIFTTTADPIRLGTSGSEAVRIDSLGALDVKSVGGASAAQFPSAASVNGITALPSATGTPFLVGRDTGSLRSAHFAGHLKFDSGYGIDFGTTTTGTGTPSGGLLDDFESGSFTPSLEFGGAATGMTFSNRSGYYTKVGNLVSAQVLIVLSAKGSSTGNATITGLPFTTAGTNGARECSAVYSFSMSGLNSLPMAVTDLSATLATLYESGASGRGNLTDANFTNSSGLVLRLTYEA